MAEKIRLARALDAAWNEKMTERPASPITSEGGPTPPALVLIVDDESGIVDFVQMGLGREGIRTIAAGTAADGLRAVRTERPDLVIVDVGLPDGDGFELLTSIRAASDVPVIMLTARGHLEDRVRGLDLGA